MPSMKGFAARRRGVRDSRRPPAHDDASTDISVQPEGRQMSGLQLIAHRTIASGKENEVLPPLPKLAAAALAEPGCLAFAYRRLDDERSHVLLERYASQEVPDARCETDHFKNLVQGEIIPRLATSVLEEIDVTG